MPKAPKGPWRYKGNKPSSTKTPKHKEPPPSDAVARFKWRATPRYIDYDDKEWGWGDIYTKQFFDTCIERLNHYESLTWAEMSQEQHCHHAPLNSIELTAKNKLLKRHKDMDNLYQVKAQGRCRLFGRKEGGFFYLIWHDPKHTVYPGGK